MTVGLFDSWDKKRENARNVPAKSVDKAIRNEMKTANEHLRKSEQYEKGYHKDGALKTVTDSIQALKVLEGRSSKSGTSSFFSSSGKSDGKGKDGGFFGGLF